MKIEDYVKVLDSRFPDTSKLEPQVKLTLKGVEYTLEYNNRTVYDVQRDCGFNLLTESLSVAKVGDPNTIGSLFHRGLEIHHGFTRDQADALFTTRHFPYITSRIREALRGYMPDMSDVELEEQSNDTPRP